MKKDNLIFPKRTIHLDFHTGPDVKDVGIDFDPENFQILSKMHLLTV